MDFWNKRPVLFALGVSAILVVAIFALPVVLFCLFWQGAFMLTIFVLDIILPTSITLAGFGVATGFLDTGIGAAISFCLLVARWSIDLTKIKWIYILVDVIFMIPIIMMSVQDYNANTQTMLAIPVAAWAYFCASDFLQGCVTFVISVVFIWLIILGRIENNKIKEQVRNGTYVRKRPLPKGLKWAAVEKVYAPKLSVTSHPSPTPPSPQSQPRLAPSVQNAPPLDRDAWYKQLARENEQQARRRQ